MRLVRTNPDDPDFSRLVRALDAELRAMYGEAQDSYSPLNTLAADTACLVVFSGEQPVATGAFRAFASSAELAVPARAEVKRMFVVPAERGRGIARALLSELEAWARERGMRELVLETGPEQKAAMALYERAGFARTPNFGPYVGMPLSVCYAKSLT
ncbi:GNAT family N-acetyltransferase [soil metagenome]